MWCAATLLLQSAAARADDKVAITLTNDNTDGVYVTVYDMNTSPPSKLLSHQEIEGFASVPLSIAADASGNGHLRWSAVAADPQARKCGRKDRPGLRSDASVHVFANSRCPTL
jgi:hypothetical protein